MLLVEKTHSKSLFSTNVLLLQPSSISWLRALTAVLSVQLHKFSTTTLVSASVPTSTSALPMRSSIQQSVSACQDVLSLKNAQKARSGTAWTACASVRSSQPSAQETADWTKIPANASASIQFYASKVPTSTTSSANAWRTNASMKNKKMRTNITKEYTYDLHE